jgi:acetyl esterase
MKWLSLLLLFVATQVIAQTHYSNLSYGPHERHVFDLWLPKTTLKASPLVIYIHGGGFSSGDKSDLVKHHSSIIKKYNKLGIAVASINYRFLKDIPLHRIMKEDIAGFVQFMRYHSKKYKLDRKRFMAMGPSAGGSASLWLGTHPDVANILSLDPVKRESSRIIAFAHINAQAGYDFYDWFNYFGEDVTRHYMKAQLWNRYHLKSFADLFSGDGPKIRQTLDSVNNMTSDDAAMYIYNSYLRKRLQKDPYDYDYFIHGPHHAEVLINKAKAVGLPYRSVMLSHGNVLLRSHMDDILLFFLDQIRKN